MIKKFLLRWRDEKLEDKIIYDKYLPSTKIIISCIEYPPLIRLVATGGPSLIFLICWRAYEVEGFI